MLVEALNDATAYLEDGDDLAGIECRVIDWMEAQEPVKKAKGLKEREEEVELFKTIKLLGDLLKLGKGWDVGCAPLSAAECFAAAYAPGGWVTHQGLFRAQRHENRGATVRPGRESGL